MGVWPPINPERALGDALDSPNAASYDGIGAGEYPGGLTSRPGIDNGALRITASSGIGAGLLDPASSGPGLVFELDVGRVLEPDSELARLFLNIDLMFNPDPDDDDGSSVLTRIDGG